MRISLANFWPSLGLQNLESQIHFLAFSIHRIFFRILEIRDPNEDHPVVLSNKIDFYCQQTQVEPNKFSSSNLNTQHTAIEQLILEQILTWNNPHCGRLLKHSASQFWVLFKVLSEFKKLVLWTVSLRYVFQLYKNGMQTVVDFWIPSSIPR